MEVLWLPVLQILHEIYIFALVHQWRPYLTVVSNFKCDIYHQKTNSYYSRRLVLDSRLMNEVSSRSQITIFKLFYLNPSAQYVFCNYSDSLQKFKYAWYKYKLLCRSMSIFYKTKYKNALLNHQPAPKFLHYLFLPWNNIIYISNELFTESYFYLYGSCKQISFQLKVKKWFDLVTFSDSNYHFQSFLYIKLLSSVILSCHSFQNGSSKILWIVRLQKRQYVESAKL